MIMNTETPRRPPKTGRRERYTFLPDPPKKTDMLQHKFIARAHVILEKRYEDDPTTLVSGSGYLRRSPDETSGFAVPDCIVAFGVEADRLNREANGYLISEVGKPPDFVLEMASKSTGVRDYTTKRRIYRDARAGEYWRFDSTGGKYHDAPLAGDILVDGEYREIEIRAEPDGTFRGYSPALDLYLVWDDGDLRFYDPEIEAFLPGLSESEDLREEAERERDDAERAAAVERAGRIIAESGRSDAERRADDERAARTEAERRAEAERAARAESDRRAEAERAARAEADRRAEAERAARAESEAARIAAEAELERLRRLLGDSE